MGQKGQEARNGTFTESFLQRWNPREIRKEVKMNSWEKIVKMVKLKSHQTEETRQRNGRLKDEG